MSQEEASVENIFVAKLFFLNVAACSAIIISQKCVYYTDDLYLPGFYTELRTE